MYQLEFRRLARCRWLEPDAAFEAMGDDARRWIEERVDELRSALLRHADPPDALDALAVRVERSAEVAVEAWEATWSGVVNDPPALAAALARADREAVATRGRAADAEASRPWEAIQASQAGGTVWRAMLDRHRAALRAPGHLATQHPAEGTCASHLRWVLAFGRDPERPSPWAPLLALFERGAWPVVLGDGSLLVYVPVRRGGGIVPSPETPEEILFPTRRVVPATSSTAVPTLEALTRLGLATPPMAPAVTYGSSARGRVVVVGPRPASVRVPIERPPRPPRQRTRRERDDDDA